MQYLILMSHYFIGSSTSEEDETESELQTSQTPNTSALETLVRTACESLAVSTLLAENSSSSNLLDAPGQQTSKDIPTAHNPSLAMEASSSSGGSNLDMPSTSALNQTSSAEDPVFSIIFGQNRDQNSCSAVDERHNTTSPSKELQESTLDLTQGSLSDIGDGEVILYMCLGNLQYVFLCIKCSMLDTLNDVCTCANMNSI